jgi:hypothetical protein
MMPKTPYLAVTLEKERALYCQNDANEMMCLVRAFQLICGFAVVVVCDIYGCNDTITGVPDTPRVVGIGGTASRGQGVPAIRLPSSADEDDGERRNRGASTGAVTPDRSQRVQRVTTSVAHRSKQDICVPQMSFSACPNRLKS